jgi:NADPH:quinone reductase-like Zn-dependent oxidoreductase
VTGQFAIQTAVQVGLDVIAVCSASTSSFVSSLGATHVVSYTGKTDMHIIGEILCLAEGRLTKAIDLVGSQTAQLVLQIIGACGRQVDFAPLAFMSSKSAVPLNAVVHTVEMKQFVLDQECRKYGQELSRLVEQGLVKIPRLRYISGGWAGIEAGLRILKDGGLVGEKLVVVL